MAMNALIAQQLVDSVPHWQHRFEIYPGVVTPGSYDPAFLWDKLRLEGRCENRRIMDIGASDGYFTLRMSRLGAAVTAADFRAKSAHGFGVMEQITERDIPYKHVNIYDIDVREVGQFDTVLFLGVLYHLPDMMRAFHKLRTLCTDTLLLETHSDNDFCTGHSAARYFKAESLAGDITNFWSPNTQCVLDMLHDAGFDVVRHDAWTDRLFVEATVSKDVRRAYKMDVAYGRL